MFDIYDEKIEQLFTSRLHQYEAVKQMAELRMESARIEICEAEEAIKHWRFAIEDYRKSHDLPSQPSTPNPFLEAEYSHMGPTELAEYWANKHDGEIVVKELVKVAMDAGVFSNYRHGSSMIYATAKRKGYTRIAPGHFKKILTSMHPEDVDGKNIPMPVASSEPIGVSTSPLYVGA